MNPLHAVPADASRDQTAAAAALGESLVGLLAARVAASPERPAVAVATGDELVSWSWAELAAAALQTASDLEAAGLVRGDRVAHLAPHGVDWLVVDLACLLAGLVHVPLHADAAAAEHREQLAWLEPRGVIVGGGRGGLTAADLPGRVVVAPPAGGWLAASRPTGSLAAALAERARATDADACCTIVLSSGTTGVPHGVMHSQRALAANARAVSEVFLSDPRDVRLAWLPASHLLARVGDLYTAIERGGCLSVVSDRTQILAACRVLPPTVILGVPAFFERLEAGVRSGRIAELAAALGGEVRVCVSGGAPLRRRTAEFFAARGVPLVEGYGLAEAGPVVSLSNPRIARPGAVGPPLAGVEVRFDERPDSRGQLLVRTPSRALAVIPPHGSPQPVAEWLETGDLARLDETGQLLITGRLKDILVLAGGVKLPPAEVERALAEDEAVAQVCVVGDGLTRPVALVVPEPAVIRRALRQLGLVVFSRRGALRHPRLLAWLGRRLARRQRHLPRAWQVRRFSLVGRAFDAAHGEATESLKLRRDAIAAHFAAEIAALATDDQGHGRKPVGGRVRGHDTSPLAQARGMPPAITKSSDGPMTNGVARGIPPARAGGLLLNRDADHHDARRPDSMPDPDGPMTNGVARGIPPARAGGLLLNEDADHHDAGRPDSMPPKSRPAAFVPAIWHGGDGGFAAAAAAAAGPLASGVEAVLERAAAEIARLRAAGQLYEPVPGEPLAVPPIADPPPPQRGRFSAAAERALGEAGVWGLAVPEAFGGAGASMLDLARAITQLAADVPTAAGTLAVHSSIGAVSALVAFGTPEQQARHLPGLAAGRPLSIFGATEPDAGCDLARIQTRLERQAGRLVLSGTKMFITGATYGRLVKLLAVHEGKPAVVLAQLPAGDTPTFRLRHYALHPLKHTHNAALEFSEFDVDERDLLAAPAGGDSLPIVWHGLNRGRTTLTGQAAGTLRLLLAHAAEHAAGRETWGRPIASRQLVQGRLGRIAAAISACDALAAWAAAAIDRGGGEWEAITAKVVAGQCVREAAIDALGIHGGRAFLVGHPLGDSLHDHFAVGVYEGESDLLGLALFRGIAKGHPLAAAGPVGGGLHRAAGWLAWRAGAWARSAHGDDAAILDRGLRGHARAARRGLSRAALAVDRAIRRHGRGLAERQLEIGQLSAVIRDLASVLAAAHHADASGDEEAVASADVWCRLALARVAGRRPGPADLAALAAVGQAAATPSLAGRYW